ncbi:MAG: PIN domain-containing protein [Thermoanaerobaculia bacterium]
MADRILVDTSAWIDALRRDGDPDVRASVSAATAEGRAVFCDLVLLELWNGAHGPSEQRVLRELERDIEKVPTPPAVWEAAFELARACRKAGVTAPATDVLIAACAEYHKLEILHHDAHFNYIARARGQRGQ